jgi:hypothetical protein
MRQAGGQNAYSIKTASPGISIGDPFSSTKLSAGRDLRTPYVA